LDVYARHTPGVEPEEYHRCFLDLSGPVPAREELESILAQVVPALAWGAAVGLASSRFLARVAAGLGGWGSKPVLVAAGREADFLTDLPVSCLWPLSPELRQRLQLLGLKTVGQVRMVPATEVVRRFGKEGRLMLALCCGVDPTPVRAGYPERTVECELSLPDEAAAGGGLWASLDILATGLARGLAERMAGTRRIELTLEHNDGRCTTLARELARPRLSRTSLREQLFTLMLQAGPAPGVTALRAMADALVRMRAEQPGLALVQEDEGNWSRLSGTLESLARKYRVTVVELGSRCPPDHRETMLDLYDPMRWTKD
jgi:DNA polymerase-4